MGALKEKWKWDHAKYDIVVQFLYALTNYHIQLNPLRAQDSTYYCILFEKWIDERTKKEEKIKSINKTSK